MSSKINKDENIGMTLQLIKKDGVSPEINATVSYKIVDSTGTLEVVSSQTATYSSLTTSYLDTLVPSASWPTQDVGSYIVVWSVSTSGDAFSPIYTENLEIGIDKNKIDKILGLVHQNIYIDNTTFDTNNNMTKARIRIYSDAASVGTENDIIETYNITTAAVGTGQFTWWKQVTS